MGWITLRVALAHLLPGIPPTFLIFYSYGVFNKLGSSYSVTLFVLVSIAVGIVIDLFRHRVGLAVIRSCNWISYLQPRKIFSLLNRLRFWLLRRPCNEPFVLLKDRYEDLSGKEHQAASLWLNYHYGKNKALQEVMERNEEFDSLKSEYTGSDKNSLRMGSSESWTILTIMERSSLNYLLNEYYSYYEFSFNFVFSTLLTGFLFIFLTLIGQLTLVGEIFSISISLNLISFFIFYELTAYWLLATKRLSSKLILFSLLKGDA